MANPLDWSNPWASFCLPKGVSYVIGKIIAPDPNQPPVTADPVTGRLSGPMTMVTVFPVDRLDNLGNATRLGTPPTQVEAQALAQTDADS
jgi:hypothetical protein